MRIALFTALLIIATVTSAQDSLRQATFSGEAFGVAGSIGFFGEYIASSEKFQTSFRLGIGKTNLFDPVDLVDNLTLPHVVTFIFPSKSKPHLAFEVGAGGALDMQRNRLTRIRDGRIDQYKETVPFYRIIPATAGVRVTKEKLFWRYYAALHVIPHRLIFPSIGVAFGTFLR